MVSKLFLGENGCIFKFHVSFAGVVIAKNGQLCGDFNDFFVGKVKGIILQNWNACVKFCPFSAFSADFDET